MKLPREILVAVFASLFSVVAWAAVDRISHGERQAAIEASVSVKLENIAESIRELKEDVKALRQSQKPK